MGALGDPGGSLFDDIYRFVRGETAWVAQPIISRPTGGTGYSATISNSGASEDQELHGLRADVAMFPEQVPQMDGMNPRYTRFLGVDPPWVSHPGWAAWTTAPEQTSNGIVDRALFSSDKRWLVRGGGFRGLMGPDDPSLQQLAGSTGGSSVYRQNLASGALELVNECTGVGFDPDRAPTLIPRRTADGLIDAQECTEGNVVSTRGALLGGGGSNFNQVLLAGTSAGAVSDDGGRVFFLSPDASLTGAAHTSCQAGIDAATMCPPQLYVRQWTSDGTATVRWISRSQVEGQAIGLVGRGVGYEFASRDGRKVLFRTNAPLTSDDPNRTGSSPVTTGTASSDSWDLYEYSMPADPDADPASGTLKRISGGPSGDEDPNTGRGAAATSVAAGVVRHASEDAERIYFVTASPIEDADNTPPAGSGPDNVAGGAFNQATSRNIYLYDASKSGAAAYKFVAKVPSAVTGVEGCAAVYPQSPGATVVMSAAGQLAYSGSCFGGTADGERVQFVTAAKLTPDDTDGAFDIYTYGASDDSIDRVTRPAPEVADDAEPYLCVTSGAKTCNGTFGATSMLAGPGDEFARGSRGRRNANVATDGAVFFESRARLLPEDLNSGPGVAVPRMDVYKWHDGELSLVSPGDSDDDSFYSGISEDGETVFIQTSKPIDAQREIDPTDFDIYATYPGAGLPLLPSRPPICAVLADACQGAGGALGSSRAETSLGLGGGNADPGVRKRLTVAGVSAGARRKAARTGRLVLAVRVSGAGKVTAVARARIGKRVRRVASTSLRARRAGPARLTLRLSWSARRQLQRRRGLTLSVQVRSPGAHSRSMSIRLPGVKP